VLHKVKTKSFSFQRSNEKHATRNGQSNAPLALAEFGLNKFRQARSPSSPSAEGEIPYEVSSEKGELKNSPADCFSRGKSRAMETNRFAISFGDFP
jgi:hypothetical protein